MSAANEFHEHLIKLSLEAFDRATVDDDDDQRAAFERHARERMAQAASVYAIDVALGAEKSAEPAFLPSEAPPAPKQTFVEAVRTSGMTEAQQAGLLAYGPFFTVEGSDRRWTLAEMESANEGDGHVIGWLTAAKVGDVLDTMHGARVERVS